MYRLKTIITSPAGRQFTEAAVRCPARPVLNFSPGFDIMAALPGSALKPPLPFE